MTVDAICIPRGVTIRVAGGETAPAFDSQISNGKEWKGGLINGE
jgi:hypothetical protein